MRSGVMSADVNILHKNMKRRQDRKLWKMMHCTEIIFASVFNKNAILKLKTKCEYHIKIRLIGKAQKIMYLKTSISK